MDWYEEQSKKIVLKNQRTMFEFSLDKQKQTDIQKLYPQKVS